MKPRTDRRRSRKVGLAECKRWRNGLNSSYEQCYSVVIGTGRKDGQGRDLVEYLSADPKRLSAGSEYSHFGKIAEKELGELCHACREMLTVVENDKIWIRPQRCGNKSWRRCAACKSNTEGVGPSP